MPIDREALTPQQRLAISRRALVEHLRGDAPVPSRRGAAPAGSGGRRGFLDRQDWIGVARNVAGRWWRRHPANAVGQLARPLLERYAREQPARLVGAAAVAGALLVLLRPWRLLSAGAVATAVMKSSDIADMVTTLMRKPGKRPD